MFPPCSGYVLTVLGRISISTIISVCFEFVLDPNPCIDYSFFDEHLTKNRPIKKAPKKRHPKLMLTQMWSQRVLYKLKVVFWDKMLLFFRLHILAIFLTLLGIITVSQPPFIFNHFQSDSAESAESQNDTLVDTRFLGCVLAVAAAITTSVWMLFLRRIENLNITFITFLQALVPVLGYNVFGAFASNKETFCIKGTVFWTNALKDIQNFWFYLKYQVLENQHVIRSIFFVFKCLLWNGSKQEQNLAGVALGGDELSARTSSFHWRDI